MQFRVDRIIKGILFTKTFPILIAFYSSVCVAWMKLIFTGDNIYSCCLILALPHGSSRKNKYY